MSDKLPEVMYVGLCLDATFGNVEWVVLSNVDEDALKQDMADAGYNLQHSFVVKVPLPNVENVKLSIDAIKTVELTNTLQ